jgi:Na+-transporting methylmalonyl-CoA/oxaloacetate decarboxylase beta subunit
MTLIVGACVAAFLQIFLTFELTFHAISPGSAAADTFGMISRTPALAIAAPVWAAVLIVSRFVALLFRRSNAFALLHAVVAALFANVLSIALGWCIGGDSYASHLLERVATLKWWAEAVAFAVAGAAGAIVFDLLLRATHADRAS